ncbi:MAG: ribonuclease HI family protein [Candidatus Dormibacteria bacterium]
MSQLGFGFGGGGAMVLNTDGGSRGNPGPAGIGFVIYDDQGREIDNGSEHIGNATNNQAEYRALIRGLGRALELRPGSLEVRMDSELVVRQMRGDYRVKHADLKPLFVEAIGLLRRPGSPRVTFRHVPREENQRADELYNLALDAALNRR